MQMAASHPTVAQFWAMRCSGMYAVCLGDPGFELGTLDPYVLYRTRFYVNLAYLDFIQLQHVQYESSFGCVCDSQHGIPRRVVFDGNSLSYRAASAWL